MTSILRPALLVGFVICALSAVAFAQDGEPVDGPINWATYAALFLNAFLVPLAVDFLKRHWRRAPKNVKTWAPLVAGGVFVMLESALLEFIGVPIDLGVLEQAILGSGGGAASTVAFKHGEDKAKESR